MRTNENGRSMIEMLGVLAIIGVLSVGGIAGYTKAMSKYRTNKVMDQLTMTVTNIRTMYAQQQTYAGLNNMLAIDLGLVSDEMVRGTRNTGEINYDKDDLTNVFGGAVRITSSGLLADGDDGAFYISFYKISRDACVAVATSDWGAGSSSGFMGLHVMGSPTSEDEDATADGILRSGTANEGSVSKGDATAIPGGKTVKVPMTVAQARQACFCPNQATCAVTMKYF